MQFKVSDDHAKQVWKDLYAMHYCRNHLQFMDVEADVIARWQSMGAGNSPIGRFRAHFCRQWLSPSRFWRWQVYHTPTGMATSNNPLEQYHSPLKRLLGLTKSTPVLELLHAMEKASTLCLNVEHFEVSKECVLSKRMWQRYMGLSVDSHKGTRGKPHV